VTSKLIEKDTPERSWIGKILSSIEEDRWMWLLIGLKLCVAAVLISQLMELRHSLNEAGCRYAVRNAYETTSQVIQ